MSKTICIYHSRDLDGWMSAAIVKKWFVKNHQNSLIRDYGEISDQSGNPDYLDILGWDYGDEIPDLSGYDKVIMVDVSFPKEEMSKLWHNLDIQLIWIDHHISAVKDNKDLVFEGFQDNDFAACELTWMYFFDRKESDKMPEIVRLLGRYDCFGHKGTDEETKVLQFQYAARAFISNYNEAYAFLIKWSDLYTKAFLNQGEGIYSYLQTEAKQVYKNGFEINLPDPLTFRKNPNEEIYNQPTYKKFICLNKERFNPINFGIDYHKDGYEGFACFWYNKGKWNWSLYNDNGRVDCSVIAKQYGGGGHHGASGMVVDTETMLKIINNK